MRTLLRIPVLILMIFRFLWSLLMALLWSLFSKKDDSMPNFIEFFDDWLTNKSTREEREWHVRQINNLLKLKPVRWLLKLMLNRVAGGEKIDIAIEEAQKREQRTIPESAERQRWQNWIGLHWAEPLQYLFPGQNPHYNVVEQADKLKDYDFESLQKLQEIVRDAESRGRKVRCVASGHALSDIAKTNDILISTKRFTAPQRRANDSVIKAAYRDGYKVQTRVNGKDVEEQRYLYETGAGTLVVDLNELLWKEGLGLLNQGGSDIQGVFGGVSTSTHGTGINIGAYPSFVKSLVLISSAGKTYRIEPSGGITDPDAYVQSRAKREGIELIQDDKTFNAVVVSMGCMGIVYSVILEVGPSYWLFEERKLSSWEAIKKAYEKDKMAFLEEHRHLAIMLNPYAVNEEGKISPNAEHSCLITTRNYHPQPKDTGKKRKAEKRERNFFATFLSGISIAGIISAWVFNRKPQNIPKNLENSFKRLVDHKEDGGGYLERSYRALNEGSQQLKFFGYAIEIAVGLDELIPAVDRILEMAVEAATKSQYHPAPIAIRFVDESPAYLSMMNQRKTATIEVLSIKNVIGGMDILHRVEEEMMDPKYNARLHWGLYLDQLNHQRLDAMYPHLTEWEIVYKKLNFKGTFDNAFSDRMGFSRLH